MPANYGGLLSNPLLNAGIGMMAASGPSSMPVGLGQALAGGLSGARDAARFGLAGQQADQDMTLNEQRAKMAQVRLAMQQQQMQRAQQEAVARERARASGFERTNAIREAVKANPQAFGLSPNDPRVTLLGLADDKQIQGLIGQQFAPQKTPELTTGQREYLMAKEQGFKGSFLDYKTALKRAGRAVNNVTTNVGGAAYKPQTALGKTVADLRHFQGLPSNESNQRVIAALQKKMDTAPVPGADQRRTDERMGAVGNIASDFDRLASKVEAEGRSGTGTLEGRLTRARSGIGILNDPDLAQLVSQESQMMTLLGTALSGAAIPESEWPKYQAQVPTITDAPAARKAKLKAYTSMIQKLKAQQPQERVPLGRPPMHVTVPYDDTPPAQQQGPAPQQAAPPGAQAIKVLGGKTFVKVNGQWFQQ